MINIISLETQKIVYLRRFFILETRGTSGDTAVTTVLDLKTEIEKGQDTLREGTVTLVNSRSGTVMGDKTLRNIRHTGGRTLMEMMGNLHDATFASPFFTGSEIALMLTRKT